MNVLWLYSMLSLGAVKTFAFLFKSAAREIRAGLEAHGQTHGETHGERVRLGLGELGQTLGFRTWPLVSLLLPWLWCFQHTLRLVPTGTFGVAEVRTIPTKGSDG